MASRRLVMDGARAELQAMGRVHDVLQGLDPASAQRVLAWVAGKLGLTPAVADTVEPAPGSEDAVASMMVHKKPSTNAERIAVLAYFLARQAGQATFRTRDLSRLNDGAGQSKFTNTAMAVKAAADRGWVDVKGRQVSLTSTGARFVESLPNRTAALMSTHRARMRRKPR